jgi:hypothetical protein
MNILIWIERYNMFEFCVKSVHVLLQVEKRDLFGIQLNDTVCLAGRFLAVKKTHTTWST